MARTRKQRGGAATDGGYGMSQQYFNPDFPRPVASAFLPNLSTNATVGDVRPVLAATNSVPLNVVQGVGSVPAWQAGQIGGTRNHRKNSRKGRKNRKSRKSRKSRKTNRKNRRGSQKKND
jgi:hypothetical protein